MKKWIFFLCPKKRSVFLAISYLVFISGCSSPTADKLEVGVTGSEVSPVGQHPGQGGQLGSSGHQQPDMQPADSGLYVNHHEDEHNGSSASGLQGTQSVNNGIQSVKTGLSAQEWFQLKMWVEHNTFTTLKMWYVLIKQLELVAKCDKRFFKGKFKNKFSSLLQDVESRGLGFFDDLTLATQFQTQVHNKVKEPTLAAALGIPRLQATISLIGHVRETRKVVQARKDLKTIQRSAMDVVSAEKSAKIFQGTESQEWKKLTNASDLEKLRSILETHSFPKQKSGGPDKSDILSELRLEETRFDTELKNKILNVPKAKQEVCKVGLGYAQGTFMSLGSTEGDQLAVEIAGILRQREALAQLKAFVTLWQQGFNPQIMLRYLPTKALQDRFR